MRGLPPLDDHHEALHSFMSNAPSRRDWLRQLACLLDERRESSLWRQLQPRGPRDDSHRQFIDLSSNDYLQFSRHPSLIEAVRESASRWGVGSASSRLVQGTLEIHTLLEQRFSKFKHAEAALLFPTGYMANLAVLSTIPQPGDLLVLDKLCHASLIDGARLASAGRVTMRTFPHGDLARLSHLLGEHQRTFPHASRFIVTDSVFSMDGDLAALPALAEVRDTHAAALIIDEAHATGVLGSDGRGLDELGVADLTISTASKALGSLGGFVTGPSIAIDWLVNCARPFIYTTASTPQQVAAIDAALDVIEREPQRRVRLAEVSCRLRELVARCGVEVRMDPTPIIPIVVDSADRALALSAHLRSCGVLAPAIRPPTVPPNSSRVRLSAHCELTDDDLDRLGAALREFDWSR